ncbi:C-x8-C-x5-C-x3-H type zinc finger protein [Colletotrichum higginsianum IMI 349063]|uniref:C-x8-C-x5-C-x3-H type zinc finger protein n=1 Tax=Colletotrichum higginsianum (strain IMI 349063) TaxID=759273 RepID=A0A1B7XQZ2_COLHI|nr:C-x8-C-x5-C-x3-H type zinc finger protein [Colletotrichum higginsianum IMI 349063]OBR02192.1 C-x8-C-x5-C-x3-H type zinc finger protein [Colletotrichum higginsianum IMI 349063]
MKSPYYFAVEPTFTVGSGAYTFMAFHLSGSAVPPSHPPRTVKKSWIQPSNILASLADTAKNHFTSAYPKAAGEDWNIIVQVVLNLNRYANKLHSSGIVSNIPTARTVADFGRGFGRAQPLFSFIDVGSGK